jgi:hypothetical protein
MPQEVRGGGGLIQANSPEPPMHIVELGVSKSLAPEELMGGGAPWSQSNQHSHHASYGPHSGKNNHTLETV